MLFETQPITPQKYYHTETQRTQRTKVMLFKTPPTAPKEYLTQRHGEHKENFYLNKKINKRWVWLCLVYFEALREIKKKLKRGVVGLSVLCGFV